MLTEEWRPVVGWLGIYEVSSLGRVRRCPGNRCHGNRLLKASIKSRTGYPGVTLHARGRKMDALVHRLVAAAFIQQPADKTQVNHINGVKEDNRVENLEWCTSQENNIHAMRTGLRRVYGEDNCRAVFSNAMREVIAASTEGTMALSRRYGVHRTTITRIRTKHAPRSGIAFHHTPKESARA